MHLQTTQAWIAAGLTALIGLITYLKCRGQGRGVEGGNKEFFLAGGGLNWLFIAGSITITNLSTDQLVGMNGNQMALLAWWELSGVVGLSILAWVFLPIYYKNNCTTVTELLEKKYKNVGIRSTIGTIFLVGNVFIYQPITLYTGALMMKSMFGLQIPIMTLALVFAVAGSLYAIFGGLRAVAITDTFSGILLLGMCMLVVFLSLKAIGFDFSGIPHERLTMIGGNNSPLPWHVLLTGMIFIQMFYWSTNQTITQRAMAAPNLKEAQKGVVAATIVRLLIVPPMVVIPGIVSYKLFGHLGDAAYGKIVWHVLPNWMSGIFAAAIASAVLAHFASVLNSSAALYVCDIHEKYVQPNPNVPRLSMLVSIAFVVVSLVLVPIYDGADSIINLVQKLNGLTSMPVLSVFIVGLLFRNVDPRAAIAGLIFGVALYAVFSFAWTPLHYIHMMFITLWTTVAFSLSLNRWVFGKRAEFILPRKPAAA
ncbi:MULTISPECIES: SLC5 family protein [Caulobacter]|jgi:SSS family solute:Na+ symporter|uniref:SSS sodium solute transporter n=1 Tax=Caulobacter vibrioides OR37 TaxID=1292034 RepID=R0EAU0_CAUVI|nr:MULTISPECIES: SLC5 family protein [Caulobacter]ENZ82593.1 SSS sodium solute transporter [Caulobacter vibrioides OR37]MBQ1563701.1 SLC5 family protein [Caulobacter sp.]